jgi:hypothetical protein
MDPPMPPDEPRQEPSQGPSPPRPFPTLPIVTIDPPPAPPPRAARERYGALYSLGIAGLVVLVSLLSWFGWSAWSLRNVWTNVYVLHDPHRPERERIAAAFALAHDPRVNQRQLWDTALNRRLPPLARYVVAEALTAEAASADPRAYGAAVARSEGWPGWLRLLLTRPMAYAVALDLPVSRENLRQLAGNPDRATALWATYALAEGDDGDVEMAHALRRAADTESPERPLAVELVRALDVDRPEKRLHALDIATYWLRHHHPEAAKLWQGWDVVRDRLIFQPGG